MTARANPFVHAGAASVTQVGIESQTLDGIPSGQLRKVQRPAELPLIVIPETLLQTAVDVPQEVRLPFHAKL